MIRLLTILFLALLVNSVAWSQEPTDFRTEQIFLSTDRRDYNPDDTIRVDGIVTSLAKYTALPYSRIVYVELIHNGSDSVTVRHKIACRPDGTFSDMILPELAMEKGDYFLRAYTRFMLNFSRDALAFHHIKIGDTFPNDDGVIDSDVNCDVYASGGALLPDIPQQIAGVLTSHLGYPVADAALALVSGSGDTLDVRRTSPSGFAVFSFVPQADTSYCLRFSAMGINKDFQVPPVNSQTCKTDIALKERRLRFALSGNIPTQKRIFTFDRCNGISEITTSGNTGFVNLDTAPAGPLTLFLTDDSLNIIAQTSVMQVDKTDFDLLTDSVVKPGEALSLSIPGINPDSATVMTRILTEDYIPAPNAVTSLQLTNNFVSPMPLPVIRGPQSSFYSDINTWLSSATFKRFNLADAVRNDSTVYRIMPERYLTLKGTIYDDENAKHPMKGGQVVAYNNADRSINEAEVDENGRFNITVNDFIDGTEFFLQATNSKGVMIKGVIRLDDEFYPAVGFLPQIDNYKQRYIKGDVTFGELNNVIRNLPDVTVKASYEKRRKRNDKKYYGVRYKDREYFEKRPDYTTLLDVLRDMPFLRVVKVDDSDDSGLLLNPLSRKAFNPYYVLKPTRLPSTLGGGAEIPVVFDENLIDLKLSQYIFDLHINQIESVEQLTPIESHKYTPTAPYGVVVVNTRKLGSPAPKDAKGTRCWPDGLERLTEDRSTGLKAPTTPGEYRIIADIVTHDGKIETLSRKIKVTL